MAEFVFFYGSSDTLDHIQGSVWQYKAGSTISRVKRGLIRSSHHLKSETSKDTNVEIDPRHWGLPIMTVRG